MYCTMYYFMLSCVVKMLFLKKGKKILKKKELLQIALNHSSDFDFKDFMKFYKKCTAVPYFFLVNDTILPLYNLLRLRKNLLD